MNSSPNLWGLIARFNFSFRLGRFGFLPLFLLFLPVWTEAQTTPNPWSYSAWTGDISVDVDDFYLYTHAIKFGWRAPSVVINEVNVNREYYAQTRSNGAKDRIELLVVQDGLSMKGMILRDFTENWTDDHGAWFRFKDVPLWYNIPAGTIIVLTTDNDEPEQVLQNTGRLWVHLYNPAYFDWGGDFDIERRDMVMLKSATPPIPSVGRPYTSAINGTPGSIHTIQGGRSDGDNTDPVVGMVKLYQNAMSYATLTGVVGGILDRWLNDTGWGTYFDIADGKDISWPTIASAKLGGEDSPNCVTFDGDVAVVSKTETLADYNGYNDNEKLAGNFWWYNTLGSANNAANQRFIDKLRASHRNGAESDGVSGLGISIGGLPFRRVIGPNPTSQGFTTSGMDIVCEDNTNNLEGAASSGELGRGFVAGTTDQTLRLTGLDPGRGYILSLFSVGAEAPGIRFARFSSEGDVQEIDQNSFGMGKGIRIDYHYYAGIDGSMTLNIHNLLENAPFQLNGFINRIDKLRQWIAFEQLPDVVTGQLLPVGNVNATYLNDDTTEVLTGVRGGHTEAIGNLCVQGELLISKGGMNIFDGDVSSPPWSVNHSIMGQYDWGLGTGQSATFTSSDPNVATIGNYITTGGTTGTARGVWIVAKGLGTTTITATAGAFGKYHSAPLPVSRTLTVRPNIEATVTLTPPASMFYDGTAKNFTARAGSSASSTFSTSFTYSYLYNDSGNWRSVPEATIAGDYKVTATCTDPGFPTSKTLDFTIQAAPNVLTFDVLPVKNMGDAPFSLPSEPSGRLSYVTTGGGSRLSCTSSDTSVATVSGSIVTIVGAGKTTLTVHQSLANQDSLNYRQAADVSQELTVRATQTIPFASIPAKTANGATFALPAVASSGYSVTYESSNPNVANVFGNVVTIVGPGTAVITASQRGDSTLFAAAPSVSQTITVGAQALAAADVVFTGPSNLMYDGTAKAYTAKASFVAQIAAGGNNTAVIKKDGTVVVWGDNRFGQCSIPVGLSEVKKISIAPFDPYSLYIAGAERTSIADKAEGHILAMQGAGSRRSWKLVAWGCDTYKQVSTFQGAEVIDIAAGSEHTVVSSRDGYIESCGNGAGGRCDFRSQLGVEPAWWRGANTVQYDWYSSVTVWPRTYVGASQVYAGPLRTYGVNSGGTITGAAGTRFNGYEAPNYINEVVPADLSEVTQIAAGASFTLALKSHYNWAAYRYERSIVAWGGDYTYSRDAGRLNQYYGGGTCANPIAIAAGAFHALILKDDGTVLGWGNDIYYGGFGNGAVIEVPAGLTGVVAIAAGNRHCVALKDSGEVVTWGDNDSGQCTVPTSRLGVSGFSYSYAGKAGTTTIYGPSANPPTIGGSYTVTATSSDASYTGSGTQDFVIASASLSSSDITITAPASLVYTGTAKTHTATAPGVSGFSISYSGQNGTYYLPSPTAPTNVGYYVATATSTDPSYSGSKSQSFTITPASLGSPDIIILNSLASLEYDRTAKNRTATVSGVTNLGYSYAGVNPTVYAVSPTAPSSAGNYSVTVTATSADGNYATSKSFPYTITRKAISITANPTSKSYGSTDPTFTYTTTGLVAPDGLTGNLTRTAGEDIGSYSILLGGLSAGGNYTLLGFTGADFTIVGTSCFRINPPGSLSYDGSGKIFTATGYKAKAIAAGPNRTLAVLTTGGVVSWGTVSPNNTMELIPGDLTDVTALAAGPSYSLALRSDGNIRSWGTDVGTGSHSILNSPSADWIWSYYRKPGFGGGYQAQMISAGYDHAVACGMYGSNRRSWAWGIDHGYGNTGMDSSGYYYNYSGYDNLDGYSEGNGWLDAKAVAAGYGFTLVLKTDGRVHTYGSLSSYSITPPENCTGVTAIAAGFQHALALKSDGTVVAWGNNTSGQANVPAGLANVIAVAAGRDHSMALKSNGTVVAWGDNSNGQTSVPVGLTSVTAIAGGDLHSVALTSDGSVVTWGSNNRGQRNTPVPLQPGVPGFTYLYKGIGSTTYGPSTTPPIQGGTYTVTVTTSLSDVSGNTKNSDSANFTIAGIPWNSETITIAPLSAVYTGTGKSVTATSPSVNGFSYSYVGVSPTIYAASATPPTNVGTYTATVTSTDPSWIGSKSQSFTITPALRNYDAITLTAPADMVYSAEAKAYTATGALVLRYQYEGVGSTDYSARATAPTDAGMYLVTVATPTADANYEQGKSAIFTILPKTVTVTATAKSKNYGQDDPALTFTASGYLGADRPTGTLARVAGEAVGTYNIVQGTLSGGSNYTIGSYTGALLSISGSPALAPGAITFFSGADTIVTLTTATNFGRNINGLACDGSQILINNRGYEIIFCNFNGTGYEDYWHWDFRQTAYGQMACVGPRLYSRTDTELWMRPTKTYKEEKIVTVDSAHPLLGNKFSLFDTPDGKLGVMGSLSSGAFTVRLYNVSTDGLTLTWYSDYTIHDTWNPSNAGMACDGTYFYRLSRSEGYKSYLLSTGSVAYDGTAWRPPAGFSTTASTSTYLARNHLTGQFIVGGDTDSNVGEGAYVLGKLLISANLTADSRLTAPANFVYDAFPKSYSVAGGWLHCLYQGTGSTSYGPTTIAPTNAGTYIVMVVANDPNLNAGGVNTVAFTITPANLLGSLTAPASLAYDGTAKVYVAGATMPGVGISYEGSGGTFYGPSAIAPTNAGSYAVTVTTPIPANYTILGGLTTNFVITPFIVDPTAGRVLRASTDSVLTMEVPTNIVGLACDGTNIFFNVSGMYIGVCDMAGKMVSSKDRDYQTLVWSHRVSNLPSGNNQMAYAGGYLYARNGNNLYRISTSEWTSTQVTVDPSYPMLTCGAYMSGSLADTPDGKLGVMGATSGGVFTVRSYTVSANGLTLTWDRDYTINDSWDPDNRGMACDGTYLYRLGNARNLSYPWEGQGYKSYNLATGTVAYDGTAWHAPGQQYSYARFMTRNHATGQFIMYDPTTANLLLSASGTTWALAPANLSYDGTAKSCVLLLNEPNDFTYSYRGMNSTTYGPSETAPSDAGDYSFTATPKNLSYVVSTSPLSFTITQAPLPPGSIKLVAPASLVYSATAKSFTAWETGISAFTYTYRGTGSTIYTASSTAPSSVGTYSVTASAQGNYGGTASDNFTIIPKPATVTADAKSKRYGTPDPILTYTYTGLLGSDQFTGNLARASGEVGGAYEITQGSLSIGANYTITFVGANLGINTTLDDLLTIQEGQKSRVLQGSTDSVLTLGGPAAILGLACDGTHIFVNIGGSSISIYNMVGVLDSSHTVSNLPSGNNQMAYAGGYLYARKGTDLFRISTSDWTSTRVTVDPSYPMLTCGDWMSGSLFDTPEGKIGVMGSTSGGVFTVRLYTVSANGLTLTRDRDYTINDGSILDNHGMACDGTYLYRLGYTKGYKSYNLATGAVAYDGTAWLQPVGFNNPTFMTRNHLTGQFIIGDFMASQVLLSAPIKAMFTAPASLAYDGAAKGYTASVNGVSGFSLPEYSGRNGTIYPASSIAPTSAGDYTVTATSTDANHVGSKSLDFSIMAKALTVTGLVGVNRAYDGTRDATVTGTVTYSGLVPGDSLVLSGTPSVSFADAGVGVSKIVSVAYTSSNPNYTAETTVMADITRRSVTVTVDAKSKVRGAIDPVLTYTSAGLLGSDGLTGNLVRASGEVAGIYPITQGSLSAGANYAVTFIGANLGIGGSLDDFLAKISTDSVLTCYSAPIFGLACDGTYIYVQGYDVIYVFRVAGSFVLARPVSNLPRGSNQMAYAGGYLYARNGDNLFRISTSDWTSTKVTVDPSYPMLTCGAYMSGSLFDTPDGKLGVMGPTSGGVFTVRLYTVSANGLTLTRDQDYTINDGWNPDNRGMACDGTYLYRLGNGQGYKSYNLATGTVAYDGTAWRQPAGFANPTFMTRNHATGQFIIGDYGASQLLVSTPTGSVFTAPASLAYDGAAKGYTASVNGVSGFSYQYMGRNGTVYSASNIAPTSAGDYRVTATSTDPIYVGSKSLDFKIMPKALTVTGLVGVNRAYDGTRDATVTGTATYSGLVPGDSLVLSGTPSVSFADAGVGVSKIVSVAYTSSNPNYTLETFTVVADITPKSVTVTADPKSKAQGAIDPVLTYTYTGLLGSDQLTGNLARASGEVAGAYPIRQGSLSAGANYAVTFIDANLGIVGKLDDLLSIQEAFQKTRVLQGSTDSVLTLEGSANILGLACDGTHIFVNSGGTSITIYNMAGVLDSSHTVSNLPSGNNQMAYAGGYLYARKGTDLFRISTSDWTSTQVTVDASYPMLTCGDWMSGSLFDTPDGKLGVMGPTSGGVFTVRLYTVSANGLTLTRDRDYTINNSGWDPDNHGMACDGTYLYQIGNNSGYRSYNLVTGAEAYRGGYWTQPAGFNNPTFMTRNHLTGQFIIGDFMASQVLLSAPIKAMFTAPASLAYDGAAKGYTASVNGVSGFSLPEYSGRNGTIYPASNIAPTRAGDYTVTATSTDPIYVGSKSLDFSIMPKALTVTGLVAVNRAYDGTRDATVTGTVTYSGLVPGDSLVLSGTPSVSFADAGVGVGKIVLVEGYTSSNPNYTVGTFTVVGDITPKGVTVTVDAKSKAQGAIDPVLTYSSSGLLGADVITGNLARVSGEAGGAYAITQGSLSVGANYAILFIGANLGIVGRLDDFLSIRVLQGSTDSVLTLEGSANILGLACDGTHIFVNTDGTSITVYSMAGALISSHTVNDLPSGNNQMAYAGGYLYARKGVDLYRISTSDWTSTQVTVDASYPMLTCGDWMSGSLFDTPDGKLGVMGSPSEGVFTVRLYTLSANGLTITRDQDFTINDGLDPDNHGMACDGTYLYRLAQGQGYKSYNLVTGAVAYDGTAWLQPTGFNNPTFMTRNHATGQFIIGDFMASQVLVSDSAENVFTASASLAYSGSPKGPTASVDGVSGFSYQYSGRNGTFYPISNIAPINAGDYRVTATSTDANHVGSKSRDFSITPKALTMTGLSVVSRAYDGTRDATVTGTLTYSGLVPGDSTVLSGTPSVSFADAGVGVGKIVSVEGYASSNPNYTAKFMVVADITPKGVTVTADPKSKAQGAIDPVLTYTSVGLLGSDGLTGNLARASGEVAGAYPIRQGSLSAGANYAVTFIGANLGIVGKLDDLLSIQEGIQKDRVLQRLTDSVLTLGGPAAILGLACDGTHIFVNIGATFISVYSMAGDLVSSHRVSNLPSGNNQMAYAGGYLYARKGTDLYRISTSDWTSTKVTVDVSYPMLTCANWMSGSLFDTPEGKIGVMGPTSGGVFTVRLYTVSANGLTLTRDRDYTINDGSSLDNHGMACDGTYLYRLCYGKGYKSYNLATGAVAYDGIAWRQPTGFANPTFMTRNHVTGQFIIGDFMASQVLVSTPTADMFTAPVSLAYDGAPKGYTASFAGVSGFSCQYMGRNGTIYPASNSAPTSAGDYTVTATSTDVNHVGSKSLDFSIMAKALTVTGLVGVNRAYDGTRDATVTGTATYSGLVPGDSIVPSETPNISFTNGDVGAGKIVTVVGYASSNPNYTLGTFTVSADITPKTVTVTADPKSKAYAAIDPVLTYSSSGLLGADVMTGNLTRLDGENAGYYLITQGNLAVGSNYAIRYTGANLSIIAQSLPSESITLAPNSMGGYTAEASGVSGFSYSYAGKAGTKTSYGPSANSPTLGGIYTVTATSIDVNHVGSASADFVVDGPIAENDLVSKPAGNSAIKIPIATLLANDSRYSSGVIRTDGLRIVGVTSGAGNTAKMSGAFILFSPSTAPTETFTYTVSAGYGSDAIGTVTVSTATTVPVFALQIVKTGVATFDGTDTTVTHDFLGVPNLTYAIEYTGNLGEAWATAGSVSTGTTGSFSVTFIQLGDHAADWNGGMFFRASVTVGP